MKIFEIAFKDIKRTFKSVFSLVMMFGAPLLLTGLLYFAFGGITSGDAKFSLPVTRVVVANLDHAAAPGSGFAAGDMLVTFLKDPSLADILSVSLVKDEAEARAEVDGQKAGVAVIIPAGFSAAATSPNQNAVVSVYQDPTLTIGPSIVRDLVSHFMDAFSGSKIASGVVMSSLAANGVRVDPIMAGQIAQQYASWVQTNGHDAQAAVPRLAVVSPSGQAQSSPRQAVPIALIMAGMIIFFTFFIGANGAESIILEDEEGTLARLLTTPTSLSSILGGKFIGVVVSLCIQVSILLLASSLLFGIQWGQPVTVLLISIGLIVAAAGFGIMIMSFIKNSRQTGPVLGGVMTLMGMVGGMFTVAIPGLPASIDKFTLITPHGWALQGMKLAVAGAGAAQVLLPFLVLLGMGFVFLAVGVILLRRRFA